MKNKITSTSLVLIVIALIILVGIFIVVFLLKENKKEIKLNRDNPAQVQDEAGLEENNVSEENNSAIKITPYLVSWGHQKAKNRSIDTIIIHSSYNALGGDPYDFSKILSEYKGIDVSPHYLIDRAGKIYQLVADQDIAYHAGESKMPDGRKSVNNFSLGIELMNTKTDKFSDEQYSSLKKLISYLKSKYPIKDISGHSQIAPGRKDDPWKFDWGRIN